MTMLVSKMTVCVQDGQNEDGHGDAVPLRRDQSLLAQRLLGGRTVG